MQQPSHDPVRKRNQLLIGALLLLMGIGMGLVLYGDWRDSQRCSATAIGQLDPVYRLRDSRYEITYTFFANGRTYAGRDSIESENPKFPHMLVRYDPNDPNHNEIQAKPYWTYLIAEVVVVLVGVVCVILGCIRR